jgi:hypothetical protein
MARGDIDAVAAALAHFIHDTNSELATAAQRCLQEVDTARFGAKSLTLPAEDQRRLEASP